MFIRKKPRPPLKAIRNYFWPAMGWGRFCKYIKHRIVRLSGTPHAIALGISFGVAASFNPYFGTHIVQACALSYIFRGNIIAAVLGTIIGNPITFPFFYLLAHFTGSVILSGLFGIEMPEIVNQEFDIKVLFQSALDDPLHILLPWTIGAYVIGLAAMPISYMIFYPLIKGAKLARAKILARKRKALQS